MSPARVSRNAPCPCGSGRKHKLCCGLTRDEERELLHRFETIREFGDLAEHFPSLRPRGRAFAAWADGLAAREPSAKDVQELIETGTRLIGRRDRRRIERSHAKEHPAVWRGLCDDLGDETLARRAVVAGAIVAGIRERRPLASKLLDLIEQNASAVADPAEALALALDPSDLWSVYETALTEDALALVVSDGEFDAVIGQQAARLSTPWHAERIVELSRRVRAQLPLPEHPKASAALVEACAACKSDASFRARVSELLLADSLGCLDMRLAA